MTQRPTLVYSGGCRFCRWVVRNIIPLVDPTGEMNIVPNRSIYASLLFVYSGPERFNSWWYQARGLAETKFWYQSEHGAAESLLLDFKRTSWIPNILSSRTLDWLDRWVKNHRPILAGWVSDGPARLRINGHEMPYDWKLDDNVLD